MFRFKHSLAFLLLWLLAACSVRLNAGSDNETAALSTSEVAPREAGPPAVAPEEAGPPPPVDSGPAPAPAPALDAGAPPSPPDAEPPEPPEPPSVLPVGPESPVVLVNDGALDNWQGEYALTLASGSRIQLLEIIVHTSPNYPDIDNNMTSWSEMIQAARDSGMKLLPDPVASIGPPLVRPATNQVLDTVPNRSEGALALIRAANQYGTFEAPIAVATGGRITDVADAFLIDQTIADKIIPVVSLGSAAGQDMVMGGPNGDYDAWACQIVAQNFRLVQVNGYYRQRNALTPERIAGLPDNPFGRWVAAKDESLLALLVASDQIGVMSIAFPAFAQDVVRVALTDRTGPAGVPIFEPSPMGRGWHVRGSDWQPVSEWFWGALHSPDTFAP